MVEPKRSFRPDFRAGVPLSPGDTKSIVLIVSSFIATSFAGFFIEVSLHSRLDPFVLEVILFVIASIWGAAGIALWHFHKITFPTAIVLLLVNFAAIFASGTLGLPEVKKSAPSPPLTARDYFDKYINQLAGLPRFPWPPPSPSASVSFSTSLLRSHSYSLYDLQMQIISALRSAGYLENTFYYVPYGFALVTRLEQIDEQRAPLDSPNRWNVGIITGMTEWSLSEYSKVLFLAPKGRYRTIVFLVSPQSFAPTTILISRDEAMRWFAAGAPSLPKLYNAVPLSDDYTVVAYIYEFYSEGREQKVQFVQSSAILGEQQLTLAHLCVLGANKEVKQCLSN